MAGTALGGLAELVPPHTCPSSASPATLGKTALEAFRLCPACSPLRLLFQRGVCCQFRMKHWGGERGLREAGRGASSKDRALDRQTHLPSPGSVQRSRSFSESLNPAGLLHNCFVPSPLPKGREEAIPLCMEFIKNKGPPSRVCRQPGLQLPKWKVTRVHPTQKGNGSWQGLETVL